MNCPVCKRELAPTLSICLTCGAMMNDTVREELAGKIARTSGELRKPEIADPAGAATAPPNEISPIAAPAVLAKPLKSASQPAVLAVVPAKKVQTAQLPVKKTSQTLVDFQAKNQTLPDWRLQIQNSVRKRHNSPAQELGIRTEEPISGTAHLQTNGATALKMEIAEEPVFEAKGSSTVENALRRIEASRKAFLNEPAPRSTAAPQAKAPVKNYPFNVVAKKPHAADLPIVAARTVDQPKPKLISSLRIEKRAYDTNKLPPLPKPAELSSSFVSGELLVQDVYADTLDLANAVAPIIESSFDDVAVQQEEVIDDLAPFSMRFASGLFDLIIAGFATLITLSPIMVNGGTWLSTSGIIAFVATLALFVFLYMTASLSFWGKTFGMRLFSLELIDAEGNTYPTIHQAAVNSAVYLLSMAVGGLGFLTVLVNEEKRAFHDIVSGTLMIRDV